MSEPRGFNVFVSLDVTYDDWKAWLFGDWALFGNERVYRFRRGHFGMDDMAVKARFFQSKTQARRNGWFGNIPDGCGGRTFGKHQSVVWMNVGPFDDWGEPSKPHPTEDAAFAMQELGNAVCMLVGLTAMSRDQAVADRTIESWERRISDLEAVIRA